MAAIVNNLDASEFTAPIKEFSELLHDTYLVILDYYLSVADENNKLLSQHSRYLYRVGKDCDKFVKDYCRYSGNSFSKVDNEPFQDGVDRLTTIQKDYLDSVSKVIDVFTVDSHIIARKNLERSFSLFNQTLNSINVRIGAC